MTNCPLGRNAGRPDELLTTSKCHSQTSELSGVQTCKVERFARNLFDYDGVAGGCHCIMSYVVRNLGRRQGSANPSEEKQMSTQERNKVVRVRSKAANKSVLNKFDGGKLPRPVQTSPRGEIRIFELSLPGSGVRRV